jgi:protein SCO1/2
MRYLPIVLSTQLFVVVFLAGSAVFAEPRGTVRIGGAFELEAPDGSRVTESTYRGRWLLVFFGYTFCPDVCPMTMTLVAEALEALDDDASRVQPIFITVDPTRDTRDVMGEFVGAFDPRIVGLTGTPDAIEAVADAYGVYVRANRSGDADELYTMDHSTYLYLMDPEGAFVRGLGHSESGESIAAIVRDAIARH